MPKLAAQKFRTGFRSIGQRIQQKSNAFQGVLTEGQSQAGEDIFLFLDPQNTLTGPRAGLALSRRTR